MVELTLGEQPLLMLYHPITIKLHLMNMVTIEH